MPMKTVTASILIVCAAALVVGSMSMFTVREIEHAIVLQFGKPVEVISEAGLYFRAPLIQEVRYFDKRTLSVDPPTERMTLSSDKTRGQAGPVPTEAEALDQLSTEASGEPINVDVFARYKIVDPLLFLQRMVTEDGANQRIRNVLSGATRDVLGKTTLRDLLSAKRNTVMAEIKTRVNDAMKDRGVEIVDIRIVRADLTDRLRTSTVSRMISERKEDATETRAKGQEQALQIRAKAERERTVLLAEAERQSQSLRGQGDEEAIRIYNDAFNKDKDFYAFLRSMEAYRGTLASPETRLILSPDSAFFQYFVKP
ncbi:MAG: protease modulator HflC [Micavibrio aeruginosavorus]|nr:protease modulator HflC [Micavibrio aeruginosavorus]